jgi:replication factor A3
MAPDTYYEVIGSVVNDTTIKMASCTPMGTNLGVCAPSLVELSPRSRDGISDMKLVDDTIKLVHDPRFYKKMFCED